MPTKRIRRARNRRADVHPDVFAILSDRDPENPFARFTRDDDLLAAWSEVRDEILAAWIRRAPGTRPTAWWRYDAPRQPLGTFEGCFWDGKLPEPRRRLGGVGTVAYEVLNIVPSWPCGIPASWVTAGDVECYGPNFAGVAIDPKDPPVFESQASYLERHGLLMSGEKGRLRKCDFEPEIVEPEKD